VPENSLLESMEYNKLRPSGPMKQEPCPDDGWVTEFTRRKERSAAALFGKMRSLFRTSKSWTVPLVVANESSTTTTTIAPDGRGDDWFVGAGVGGLVGCLVGDRAVSTSIRTLALFSLQTLSWPGCSKQAS